MSKICDLIIDGKKSGTFYPALFVAPGSALRIHRVV